EIVEAGTLPTHQIRIPGIFVDYLVQADHADHWQTYGERFNASYTGASRLVNKPQNEPFPLDAKKIIARRAYMETTQRESPIINLGIGTPEYIARVMMEEHDDNVMLTVESGAIGGTPAGGLSFGASRNPQAILDQPSQFDFYDGGGIDVAFLGFGQIDRQGNVNVSRLNGKINGVGGFVNISQSARKVVFCGTFTGRGLGIDTGDGQLRILREGEIRKFVDQVDQLSFNASLSAQKGQEVLYITERAVFRLRGGRLHLIEAAPGVDIDRDILRQIDADVVASDDLRVMDANLFRHAKLHDSNGLYKFCT
ncbi:MAG TPA: acyl CoA:acetate/3-ketoacid CoA transferase, partial [Burkholderiales bacterium]|nr:acyl CoA:acetate/3-ketoacid CoA transferase [Burkholderiales bacterium]